MIDLLSSRVPEDRDAGKEMMIRDFVSAFHPKVENDHRNLVDAYTSDMTHQSLHHSYHYSPILFQSPMSAIHRVWPVNRAAWRQLELIRSSYTPILPTASTSRIQFRSYAASTAATTTAATTRNVAKDTEKRLAKAKKVAQMPGLSAVRQDQPLQGESRWRIDS